jgi:hypothetical protein
MEDGERMDGSGQIVSAIGFAIEIERQETDNHQDQQYSRADWIKQPPARWPGQVVHTNLE